MNDDTMSLSEFEKTPEQTILVKILQKHGLTVKQVVGSKTVTCWTCKSPAYMQLNMDAHYSKLYCKTHLTLYCRLLEMNVI